MDAWHAKPTSTDVSDFRSESSTVEEVSELFVSRSLSRLCRRWKNVGCTLIQSDFNKGRVESMDALRAWEKLIFRLSLSIQTKKYFHYHHLGAKTELQTQLFLPPPSTHEWRTIGTATNCSSPAVARRTTNWLFTIVHETTYLSVLYFRNGRKHWPKTKKKIRKWSVYPSLFTKMSICGYNVYKVHIRNIIHFRRENDEQTGCYRGKKGQLLVCIYP